MKKYIYSNVGAELALYFSFVFILFLGSRNPLLAQQDTTGYETDLHDLRKETETIQDINKAIPQKDYLFTLIPKGYSDFKKEFYSKTGIQFGLSYQSLYQRASNSLTETNTAWGGWLLFEFSWVAFNKEEDYQGRFVFTLDDRHIINASKNQAPAFFRQDIGSLWATDAAYLQWNIYPLTLFWEQTFKKGRLGVRVGQFAALNLIDFFRFADPRASFTGTQMNGPVAQIPVSPPGLGMAFKWWPIEDSELYIVGLISDINASAGELDWGGLFEYGEVFLGGEIGYNVIRGRNNFDHYHLTLWYGDELSSRPYPTKAGWGFKIHGSKQWDRIVLFGNYAYNTAEGGGFNYTNTESSVNLGLAYQNLFNIRGELAMAGSWAQPLDDNLRNQAGIETYWRLLMGSDLWVTPGVQFLFNPSLNTTTDFISIPHIKMRLFL